MTPMEAMETMETMEMERQDAEERMMEMGTDDNGNVGDDGQCQ